MRIEPNVVVQLQQRPDEAQERHAKKKIDPLTGIEYNTGNTLVEPEVRKRLRNSNQSAQYVANGFAAWNANLVHLEDFFGEQLAVVPVTGISISQANQAITELIYAALLGADFEFTLKN